jgi:hypothetical protein
VRDLPDPVGLADLRRHPHETSALVDPEASPQSMLHVPWPKLGGLRDLVVLDSIDELTIRSLLGFVAEAIDRHLPARPSVSSYRLRKGHPGWDYQHPKHAHESHREHLESLVRSRDFGFLVLTDVEDCYGTITPERCLDRVDKIAGPHPAMLEVYRWLDALRSGSALRGLPIGPEWSPTLAHALLSAVDAALVWSAYSHGRWSDDVAAVGTQRDRPERLLDTVDTGLGAVGLKRSAAKTAVIGDPNDAIDAVRDRELSALLGHLDVASIFDPSEHIYDVFDRAVEEPERRGSISRFRFALRTLGNRGDAWAARRMVLEPVILELDPATCGRYLASVAHRQPSQVAPLFDLLEKPPSDRAIGTHVHILRAASSRGWGTAEAIAFDRAGSIDRPEVVRWWAGEAIAQTPGFDPARCLADVETAELSMGRRRAALPLRREPSQDIRRQVSAVMARTDARLISTCSYLSRLPSAA